MNIELAEKTCIPCKIGGTPLTEEQANQFLKQAENWTLSEDKKKIFRKLKFTNFVQAMSFVNAIAVIAETQGHHPDIEIVWNKVTFTLWTHLIQGLHENDFILAAKIDKELADFLEKPEEKRQESYFDAIKKTEN